MEEVPQIQAIELSLLHAHPKNANVMPAATMRKVARHIEATGRYEALVVRKHPKVEGAYELINGHHRKRILESLGRTHANCVVWELSDAQTLLLLATINRLGGEDGAGKRLELIEALAQAASSTAAELAAFLPEDEGVLEKLLKRCEPGAMAAAPLVGEMPEALTIFLTAKEKREVTAALARTDADPAKALLAWARR